MNDRQYLYKTLDNPIRVLFWSIDEFLLLVAPLFLSLCFGSIFFLLGGAILKPSLSKIKKHFPHGSLKHRLYWMLPKRGYQRIKHLPESYHRELLL